MNLLSQYIIYKANDISAHFLNGLSIHDSNNYYYGYTNNNFFNQINMEYLTFFLTKLMWKVFDPITTNNLQAILAIVLNLYFSYKLFKELDKNKNLLMVLAFTLFLSFCPYFLFRLISATASLYFIFPFPLVLTLLIKRASYVYIAIVNFFTFFISLYYGYFLAFLVISWILAKFITDLIVEKKANLSRQITDAIKYFVPILVLMLIVFGGLIISNLGISPQYKENDSTDKNKFKTVYRPIEDFYNFTLRPWYFFIPPNSSLFFQDLSNKVFTLIKDTNYYLADDYQEEELGGSYLGWHFIIGLVIAVYMVLKKQLTKEITIQILMLLFSFIFLVLITGPPSFTISGVEIFTPSYLLYKFVPGFRVIGRMSIIIYMISLVINYIFLQNLAISKNKMFITILLFLTFFITAIKVPIVNTNNMPPRYKAIEGKGKVFAVLPKATYEDTFWVMLHKNYLYNPKDLKNQKNGFSSENFNSEALANIEIIKKTEIEYIIVNLDDNKEDLKRLLERLRNYFGLPIYIDETAVVFKI